jgi:hypothetical protein
MGGHQGGTPWRDAMEGCHGGMPWRDAMEGRHGGMPWRDAMGDAMGGCHGGKNQNEWMTSACLSLTFDMTVAGSCSGSPTRMSLVQPYCRGTKQSTSVHCVACNTHSTSVSHSQSLCHLPTRANHQNFYQEVVLVKPVR